jgi:hypothetical protein
VPTSPTVSPASLRRLAVLIAVVLATVAILAANPGRAHAAASNGHAAGVPSFGVETPPNGLVATGSRSSIANSTVSPMLCSGHAVEYGDWVNADPSMAGIARIELRDCQSVTVCNGDICSITYDAGWIMHVFGKCSPTNCDWGWTQGQFRLSSGHIYGFYDQGFAKRYVWAKMSQYRPGQLWVDTWTDFVDPNRADYDHQDWFVRA